MKKVFGYWLFAAYFITIICALVYGVGQQILRQGAYDPQIQIARDLGQAFASGQSPQDLGQASFDIEKSLSPFIVVYDSSGKALVATALLNGRQPNLPVGVFDYTKKHGEDMFTWQPKNGVRVAAVVEYFSGAGGKNSGFVLAGKSLKEVELRIVRIGVIVGAAWILLLISGFIFCWFICGEVYKDFMNKDYSQKSENAEAKQPDHSDSGEK